jgi:CubicO group peptidase (beta-lactamase class C family)
MFVSLAVLKLVEQGRLSLDDRLAALAPDVEFENEWEETDPIRIVHLLEHTTGWDDIHLPEYAHNDPTPATLKEGLDFHPHSRISRWKPGSRMSYCNAGPPVAAYVVEQVTGKDFESYVYDNFFEPMGMQSMTYRLSEAVQEKGVTLYANGNQPQDYWHISVRPSGSINASANDMAKMVEFFVNRGAVDGEQLISPRSLSRMETTGSTPAAKAGQQVGYGLGNYSSIHESWEYLGHGGGVNGGVTELAYLPQARVGHAIMTNSDDFATFIEISDLIRNFETRNLAPAAVTGGVEVNAEHKAIAGLYQPINSRQQVGYFLERALGVQKLAFDGDTLVRKALLGGEATGYYPVTDALFKHDETGLISLSRVDDPLAGPVVHVGTLVMKPVSPVIAYGQLGIAVIWGICIVTSILFFLVWGVRKLRGKVPAGPATWVRAWPLFAGLSILAVAGLFSLGMTDPFGKLGAPTPVSVGIMVSTLAFAVSAFLGMRISIRSRHLDMNRWAYWHSTIASGFHVIVAAYLLWFGVIGLMTWA